MAVRQVKQNSKDPLEGLNKAIPKIVSALQSIIAGTKDEEFRERCLRNLSIHDTTAMPCKLELKLWKIAEKRLGVKQPSIEDGKDEQVVPGEKPSQTNPVNSNSNKRPSFEKDPFDELALIDISYPLTDANEETFYKENDAQNLPALKQPLVSSSAGKIPIENSKENPQSRYLDDELIGQAGKDDWLKNFKDDSFWMDENHDCSLYSSQDFIKRQRSPVSSRKRKIETAITGIQQNVYDTDKDQIRNGPEIMAISDEQSLQNKVDERSSDGANIHDQFHRYNAPSQNLTSDNSTRIITRQTLDGFQDNTDSALNQNEPQLSSLSLPHSHPFFKTNGNDDIQIIKVCGSQRETLVNDIHALPDIHEENNEIYQGTQSPQLEIIKFTNNSLINDFDSLADFFD